MDAVVAGRRLRVDPRAVDALLVAAAVTIGQLDLWLGLSDTGDGSGGAILHHRGLSAALLAVGLSMLALRRRAPVAGLTAMLATIVVQTWVLEAAPLFWGGLVPVLFMVYAVGAFARSLRDATLGLAVAAIGVQIVTLRVPDLRTWDNALFDSLIVAAAWSAGAIAGAGGRRADELASRASRLEREQEQTIADERARLARELHDIVAHSVSVIAVQAEAGEALLEDEPDRAAEAFRSIQGTSRQALVELRRLLGLLRDVDGTPALAPQPGLAEVAALVDQVRAAGLRVDLAVEGRARPVDPGVDLSAFRVVQEALTNALRHAGCERARVCVRYQDDAIDLEIVDDGCGVPAASADGHDPGGGHGLVGMRERIAVYGGELRAESPPEGGFAVRARLPLRPRQHR